MRLNPPPILQRALGAGLRHCPFALKKGLLAPLLQHVFAQVSADGDLDFLRHRRVAIHLLDLGDSLQLTYDGHRLTPVAPTRAPDVTIGGDCAAFLQLAARRVDPDTLFFQRRLSIEGDTELGLAVKNLLDGLDEERLPRWARQLLTLARRLKIPAP